MGMSVDELFDKLRKKARGIGKSVNKSPIKYQNPGNSAEQWKGRDHRPKWVMDALIGGTEFEHLGV